MNDLILVFLIIFIIVRVIGLAVSLDFYYDTRKNKFKIFSIGWALWIIAAIMPIYSTLVKDAFLVDLLLVLNVLFFSLGALFYGWGIYKYFLTVPVKIIESLIIITIAATILFWLIIGKSAVLIFLAIFIYALLISTYIIPPFKKENFKKFIGKSIRWYFTPIFIMLTYIPVSIVIYLHGYGFGLYSSNDVVLIILNYIPTIGATFLMIVLLVHLEYNISSREKFDLKDKYSHELGNIMQAIFTSYDLIKAKREPTQEVAELEALLETKLDEASALIKQIRKL